MLTKHFIFKNGLQILKSRGGRVNEKTKYCYQKFQNTTTLHQQKKKR